MTESLVPTEVRENFEIPAASEIQYTGDGFMNQSWIISQDGEQKFVLKRYNSYRALDDIMREHRFLQSLAEILDCGVPRPVGDVFTCENRNYGLFHFIPGNHPEETPEAVDRAAHLLAHVHCQTDRHAALFAGAGAEVEDADDLTAPQEIAAALKAAGVGEPGDDMEARLVTFHESVRQTLDDLRDCISHKHLIHGDFGFRNLIDSGADGFALIDWDEMRIASPLFEVAAFCAFTEASENFDPSSFVEPYLSALKAGGYEHIPSMERGLSNLEALAEVVRYRELSEMVRVDMIEEDYIGMLLP